MQVLKNDFHALIVDRMRIWRTRRHTFTENSAFTRSPLSPPLQGIYPYISPPLQGSILTSLLPSRGSIDLSKFSYDISSLWFFHCGNRVLDILANKLLSDIIFFSAIKVRLSRSVATMNMKFCWERPSLYLINFFVLLFRQKNSWKLFILTSGIFFGCF